MRHPFNYYVTRIAHFIEGYRQRKGLTYKDLEKEFNMSVSSLNRVAHKKKEITLYDLFLFSQSADLSLSEFVGYLENNPSSVKESTYSPWVAEVKSILQKLPDKLRSSFILKCLLPSRENTSQEEMIRLFISITELDDANLNLIKYIAKTNSGG